MLFDSISNTKFKYRCAFSFILFIYLLDCRAISLTLYICAFPSHLIFNKHLSSKKRRGYANRSVDDTYSTYRYIKYTNIIQELWISNLYEELSNLFVRQHMNIYDRQEKDTYILKSLNFLFVISEYRGFRVLYDFMKYV